LLEVFENKVLRKIFGLKRGENARGWRTFHEWELHNLSTLPNIIKMIKSRRRRWEVHVAPMVKKRNPYRILMGKAEGNNPKED
jgi:hypothetical protein